MVRKKRCAERIASWVYSHRSTRNPIDATLRRAEDSCGPAEVQSTIHITRAVGVVRKAHFASAASDTRCNLTRRDLSAPTSVVAR